MFSAQSFFFIFLHLLIVSPQAGDIGFCHLQITHFPAGSGIFRGMKQFVGVKGSSTYESNLLWGFQHLRL